MKRIGAIAKDGTISSATGRGACSHHGGVQQWLYEKTSVPSRSSTKSFSSFST